MAVDVFHTQIASSRMAVKDLVLKLSVKLSTEDVVWATLRPEQWTDIAQGYGSEIRVGSAGIELDEFQHPVPTLMFKGGSVGEHGITVLLPKTYEVSMCDTHDKKEVTCKY